ncbi:hypothetical protein WJ55_07010 [Burkholderia ubonensis]|nr:hypothetical protein WI82_07490 [Burkholderia ubonensis]KVG70375.1 hypothetical protein WJ34_27130 [Burkholderia ubonensis]KVH26392.1 hypothetical protein WJ37_05665 [Burkholderia ubonensis]KVH46785.1 hypothetical protein WJ38_21910 [Burkholderia ubonensis]KVH87017.1 hypothetical protein WJ43_03945 [Burkholderia ubonensis]
MLDLSRQQRNLLLLRPVFQLERYKMMLGDESGLDRSLFQGVDTHYLALSALDQMMEATTVSGGSTSTEILTYLAEVAIRMKPTLSAPQARRVAEVVLDALDNKANNHREFSFEYFDAPSGSTNSIRFRLVRFEPDAEDVYRYRPTAEGYLVYLGMLDLSPEDSQELMEKMLDLLVQRGRFDAALEIARRARKLSIEYRQLIRDRLYQAYRAPGSVNWSRDMAKRLDEARTHVCQRQAEDARMEEAVGEALLGADEPKTRESLVQLKETIRSAGLIRLQLVTDINVAPERFIEAQRAVFRARRPTGLPDLEPQLLPQLVNLPTQILSAEADVFISALYPPVWPRVYDLNSVFALLLEQRGEDAEVATDPGSIEKLEPLPDQFSKELVQRANEWLADKFSTGQRLRIDQLLDAAEDEGLDRTTRRCLVLILFRSFARSESEFKNVSVELTGDTFHLDIAQGSALEFVPQGESE